MLRSVLDIDLHITDPDHLEQWLREQHAMGVDVRNIVARLQASMEGDGTKVHGPTLLQWLTLRHRWIYLPTLLTLDQVLAWCDRHDDRPTEGWLVSVLNGEIAINELREAIREDRDVKL